jgi:hypothetical protein
VVFIVYQRKIIPTAGYQPKDNFYKQASLLGVGILLLGGIPYWLTARLITVGTWSNRLSLAPMLGAILSIVLLVDWLFRTQKQKSIFLAALLCISIAAQVRNTDTFRRDWDTQRDYYWQLAWRAPKLDTGTAIFASEYPTHLTSTYAFSYAINTIYGGAGPGPQAQYWYFTPADAGKSYKSLVKDADLSASMRNIQYQGNLSHAIAVSYHPSAGCLRIIQDAYIGDPAVTEMDLKNLSISSPEIQILDTHSSNPPYSNAIGKEPERGWCYYFQKADLARQFGKWNEILSIMSQADQLSLAPKDGAEYLPLMDAYANADQWSEVLSTSDLILQRTKGLEPFLCNQWQRYQSSMQTSSSASLIDSALEKYHCDAVE